MVAAFIFILHFAAIVVAFFKNKKESIGEGLLAMALVGIVFAVGWTIATMLTNLLFTPEWFIKWFYQPVNSYFWYIVRKEFNRDTISLLILTTGEIIFYYFYFTLGTKKGSSDDEPSS